ncbi:phage tail protein [Streptomyces sp.]|uniref:phage tail protein n=1 Tax=Streptomyces sp. TaxID=1931 RepID=UPI002F4026F1
MGVGDRGAGGGSGEGGGGAGAEVGGEGAGAGGGGRTGGRALVPGLVSRYPLGLQLPGVYAEDDFVQRFAAGLDEVLAPALSTLDNLPAYLDPGLAPADFVALLAAWLGAEPAADGAERSAVSGAVRAHAVRGTRAGLADEIRLAFGVVPDITESGGALGSTTPGSPLPGSAVPHLTVRLRVPDPTAFDTRALTALVTRSRPAHLPVTVEVLGTD